MNSGKCKIAVMGILGQQISNSALGGTEIFTAGLVDELVNRGHEVTLFGTSDSDVKATVEGTQDSSFFSKDIKKTNLVRRAITFQIDLFMDFLKVQHNFDFLHISVAEYYSLIPLLKLLEIPYCITAHNKILENEDLEILSQKYPDINLVYSQVSSKEAAHWKNKTRAILHGIDVGSFAFNENPSKYLSWVGRLTHDKGLESFSDIQKFTQKEIIFGGSGEDREYFKQEIEPIIKQNEKIKFSGSMDHARKNELLKNSYLFINPRIMKPTGGLAGLVVMEANACGTPVVAYDSEAMREIIKDDINGYLVPMGDLQAFSEKVQSVYEMDEGEYAKLRHKTREYAEKNFSIQKMVDQYEKIYFNK